MIIMSGERFQEIADVYLGYREDFEFNPRIFRQKEKHVDLSELNNKETFHNPPVIFCYSHRVEDLYAKLDCFQNKFVLMTHNSDENQPFYHPLLASPKIIKWYAQNVAFFHPKLVPLPIGIANEMWTHGSDFIQFYRDLDLDLSPPKTNLIYFHFRLSTNSCERQSCFDILTQKNIPFLPSLPPLENLQRMVTYRYCICPTGNGLDTHRFWEALYLHCVPIVIDSPWIRVLQYHYPGLPVLVLRNWNDLDPGRLSETFEKSELSSKVDFQTCPTLLSSIQQRILSCSKQQVPPATIVLVSVGVFQEYIRDNLKQLLYLGHENRVYVITNKRFFPKLEEFAGKIHLVEAETLIALDEQESNAYHRMNVDRDFRDEFWTLTSSRFFYLYYAMRELHLEHVIHLENDVLVYYSCDDILPCFDPSYIYMPFDSPERNIASIVYIPNHSILRSVLDHYDFSKNDMYNFTSIRVSTKLIRGLPIFPSGNPDFDLVTQHYSDFGGIIFDAAAMGQFLGGVDPRNMDGDTTGFINETCIVKYTNPYFFYWNHHHQPHLCLSPNFSVPIFNLHIHSKRLDRFTFSTLLLHDNALDD